MDIPIVSILFITYKRIELLKRTYESFINNTEYPREKLELILCDDGSPKNTQEELRKLKFDKYLFANKNEGMAANVNKGILAASGEFILQLQDDWICHGPKDYLGIGVNALLDNNDIGIIRYRLGIKYPNFTVRRFSNKTNSINILDWEQGDPNITQFIYSDNPHLKRSKLHREIGLYKPFQKMTQIEIEFCKRFNNLKLFRVGYIDNYGEVFEHIGDELSFRRKELHFRIKSYLAKNVITKKIYSMLSNHKSQK